MGKRFSIRRGCEGKVDFADKCPVGTVHSVVRRKGDANKVLYFQFFNHDTYRRAPPATICSYATVASFVSNDTKKRFIEFEKEKVIRNRAPREKKTTWAYVTTDNDEDSDSDD
jgi:hypothetical protein